MGKLHEMLLANDKKKLFDFNNIPSIGYPSGLLPLDYSNGYWVHVNSMNKKDIPNRWLNIGTQGGTFYTIIGNSGVAKTTLAVQIGSAEILDFTEGNFYHIDAEGTSNETRVQQLNRFTDEQMMDKYHFPDLIYVEDVFTMIYNIAQAKIANKEFAYHTGCYDTRGNEIVVPQPTVILIDSLPSLQTKDVEESDQLGSQTYNMRLAIAYNTFYKRLRPIIRDANITVIAINHLKEKPDMGFTKTQAKIQYLKPNESIPGGSGPIYYSQNLLRMIYRGKYTEEKNGFGGFKVEAVNIKSKTNKSGTSVSLIFHEKYGFEPTITMMNFAEENGLICGRNPYCFFKEAPDVKFSTKDVEGYIHNEQIQKLLIGACKDILNGMVGDFSPQSEKINNLEWMKILDDSYAKEKDAGRNDEVVPSSPIAVAASRMLSTPRKIFKKPQKAFEGIHRYGVKKNPAIEMYMDGGEFAKRYINASIREMHTVTRHPETGEVVFYV